LRILTDPPFAARIGAAARERAADFSDTAYAAKVISTIREFSAS
jgi:hypothetical protein